jgi:hypothetical protein
VCQRTRAGDGERGGASQMIEQDGCAGGSPSGRRPGGPC